MQQNESVTLEIGSYLDLALQISMPQGLQTREFFEGF
jgi:hypothetical protein